MDNRTDMSFQSINGVPSKFSSMYMQSSSANGQHYPNATLFTMATTTTTPLDPLLKHLKKTYAASAGPKDVLGAISKEGMDRWLSPDDGHCDGELEDWTGNGDVEEECNSTRAYEQSTGITIESFLHQQQQQSSIQLPQQFDTTNSSLVDVAIPPIKLNKRQERRMPDFCYAPTTHVDNLLRTMPHLRHLSTTDMKGLGIPESTNVFHKLIMNATTQSNINNTDDSLENVDYPTSVLRQQANNRASLELASFLRILSNEMSHDKFITVESEVYSTIFSLVHSKTDRAERLAGVTALDALLSVPSFDQDKKTIRFGNNLSNGLKASTADYEFLHAVSRALGKMACSAANVDRVEFEIGRSLEWLRSDRGDHRRLAAVLVLRELAREAPTAFYSKTQQSKPVDGAVKDGGLLAGLGDLGLGGSNEFLDNIFPVLRDRQLIVRVCAADALSECVKILMDRQPNFMTAPLCNLFSDMMQALNFDPCDESDNVEKSFNCQGGSSLIHDVTVAIDAHGSLLAVGTFLDHTQNFIMPREFNFLLLNSMILLTQNILIDLFTCKCRV
eukprot:scaffold7678_cov94-Cyclotella_meneghiniana.AAC.3